LLPELVRLSAIDGLSKPWHLGLAEPGYCQDKAKIKNTTAGHTKPPIMQNDTANHQDKPSVQNPQRQAAS
jgi:hypothetical protein